MSAGLGVVFDLDDTLYPARRFGLSGYAAVARHVEARHGVPSREVFRDLAVALRRGRFTDAFQACSTRHGLPPDATTTMLEVFRSHEPRLRLPRESAHVLLTCRRLARVGILTNGLPAIQRRKVAALGLEPLVDAVIYAHEHAAEGKPAPAAFDAAHEALGRPARMLMVGDNLAFDVGGALRAGWTPVWFTRWTATPCDDAPSHVIRIARLADLLPLAENMGEEDRAEFIARHSTAARRR
ncbi:MAG: HAD family hydrolase [Vicinamibacterales bacterium]